MPVADIELMLRIQAGDEEAFEELFHRHAPGLLNFFFPYCLDWDEAEDAVQEVFQRVWTARDHYAPRGRFRSYLLRIATNYVIDRSRTRKRRSTTVSLDAPARRDESARPRTLKDDIAGRGPAPDRRMLDSEAGESIEEAVQRLPEAQRVVFLLGVQEGVKYSEIGRILGIPVGTVKSRMHSAIHTLRDRLAREDGPGEDRD